MALLSVGDEIILGQIEDSNAPWLARELQALGAMPGERRTVGDDRARIAAAMQALARNHRALILTGGLGPTLDDLTRDALADAGGPNAALVVDEAGVVAVRAWFAARGRAMPESNLRQAFRPATAQLLDNPNGTAPGLTMRLGGCQVFCLPGPPNEMKPMFLRLVAPLVRREGLAVATAALHTIGVGESALAEMLGELMDRDREPTVGTTASGGIVTVRVRSVGTSDAARAALEETVRACTARLGTLIYGRDGEPLAAALGALLVARQDTLVTAESCTGGLLSAMLTDIVGSSAWFRGGFITYENARKTIDLGVKSDQLTQHGAVSHEVAIAMARGALLRTNATVAIATTGIAGPSGGSDEKPVGTVFVSVAVRGEAIYSRRFHFPGDRASVRLRTASLALASARFALLGEPTRDLLWSASEALRVEQF